MMIDHHPNEYETLRYPSQVEPSSRTLIFDTKDLFDPPCIEQYSLWSNAMFLQSSFVAGPVFFPILLDRM